MISDDEIMQAFSISDSEGYWKLLDSYCSYVYAIVSSHVRGLASEQDKEECIADIFIETVNACRKQNIDSLSCCFINSETKIDRSVQKTIRKKQIQQLHGGNN